MPVDSNAIVVSRSDRLSDGLINQVGLVGGEHEHALQPFDRLEKLIRLPQGQPEASGQRQELLRCCVINL